MKHSGSGGGVTGTAGSLPVVVANLTAVTTSTPTLTQVSYSTSSQTALAANANRKDFKLFNTADRFAYVAFGATATSSAFTIRLDPGAFYEPNAVIYIGAISVIFASGGSGSLVVTELT